MRDGCHFATHRHPKARDAESCPALVYQSAVVPALSPKRPPPVVATGLIGPFARFLTLSVEALLLFFVISYALIGGESIGDITIPARLSVEEMVVIVSALCVYLVVIIP
jgi:hypothetical protein